LIFLEPIGGLANRIRVIATAISLSKKLNKKLFIVWNENYELNCPFKKLFEPIENVNFVEKRRIDRFIKRSVQNSINAKNKAKLINAFFGIDYCLTDEDHPFNDLYERLISYKNIYIKTCQRLNEDTNWFKVFKPINIIEDKIGLLTNKFTNNTVGIQIRRTDNIYAIEESPLKLFIKKMDELIALNPSVVFFLTTDDLNVESELKSLYEGRVISHQKELSRTTQIGIQDAVADLFTLSKTNLILGSYWSSFSEVAAWIGHTSLQIIKRASI
jgi:hypothetical protein